MYQRPTMRFFPVSIVLVLPLAAAPVRADVITSEFSSLPVDEGWTLVASQGDIVSWVADGIYYQDLPNNCPLEDVCENEAYSRFVDAFNGRPTWFYEFRVSTTGDHNEIPAVAPTVLAAGNGFGELYHATVASDRIKLLRDFSLPILFFDLEAGVPHTIRLELDNAQPPTYEWFIDSVSVDFGFAEDFFPSNDARIVWAGETWMQPTLNKWFYIRAGDIPIDASADFDSDGEVNEFELFYIEECIQRSADGETAAPSCAWADVTGADNAVTCDDWQIISDTMWTGPDPPPDLPSCIVDLNPIPAVSDWGVGILLLLALTAGTVVFRHRHQPNL